MAVQVKADRHTARARIATAGEARAVAHHDRDWGALSFQANADREIPVVVLEPG